MIPLDSFQLGYLQWKYYRMTNLDHVTSVEELGSHNYETQI